VLARLLRLRGVRLQAHPTSKRTYIVLEYGDRVGEISFSAYESKHTGLGWRICEPPTLNIARYRSRGAAAWALIRETRS